MSLDHNLVEGDDSLFICEELRVLVYFSGLVVSDPILLECQELLPSFDSMLFTFFDILMIQFST